MKADQTVLQAVITGMNRPVSILPGLYGARFIVALYNEIAHNLPPAEQKRFDLIRSMSRCAIEAANKHTHKDAMTWLDLAYRMQAMQPAQASMLSFSCIKSAESYVFFANQQYDKARTSLDQADQQDSKLSAGSYPVIRAQRLHYLHLASRIELACAKPEKAIQTLVTGLNEASRLAESGNYHYPELLSYACSRMAGELAMAGLHDIAFDQYLQQTCSLENMNLEGSVAEYMLYRKALEQYRNTNNLAPLLDFVAQGRMKTVCWYCAVVELAATLDPVQRPDLVTLSSEWNDMPAFLQKHLLKLLTQQAE